MNLFIRAFPEHSTYGVSSTTPKKKIAAKSAVLTGLYSKPTKTVLTQPRQFEFEYFSLIFKVTHDLQERFLKVGNLTPFVMTWLAAFVIRKPLGFESIRFHCDVKYEC